MVPGRKAAGMKTEAMTSTTAMSEAPISSMALIVASFGGRFFLTMFRSTFSTTTMASSTTIPIASTMPNRVSRLTEKPSASIPENVPMSATKIAIVQMNVERKLCRNRYTTNITRRTASNSVWTTSSMEIRTKSVVSRAMRYSMPAGSVFFISSIVLRTASETSRALEPACW